MSENNLWVTLFREYEESGLTKQRFCKEKSISYNQFQYYWHRGNKNSQIRGKTCRERSITTFESITIKDEVAAADPLCPSLSFIIHLPNQISCEIKEGVSREGFSELLKQLVQLC